MQFRQSCPSEAECACGGSKTGLDWAEELSQRLPNIGVICVTGYNDRYAQHILLRNFNLVGYLTMPLDVQLLSRYHGDFFTEYREQTFTAQLSLPIPALLPEKAAR